jgi:hypothetical protein
VPLPTRYIEILSTEEAPGNHSHFQFRLREANSRCGKYIALSHRWTDAANLARTTKANFKCRLGECQHAASCTSWDDEPLSELFKDAGWLALNLGVRYIWIDSVCIIQDDKQDWAIESIKMAEYYQYACITLAATHTSSHGCLRDETQHAEMSTLARLPYRDKSGQRNGHFYLQAVGAPALSMIYQDKVSKSALLMRGWVYQEWLLSRRIISFSNFSWGIFMQCQSGENPQSVIGDLVGTDFTDEGLIDVGTDKAFKNSFKLDMSSAIGLSHFWRTIVRTYSGLELKHHESDRLVALAGIASEFGEALQGNNLHLSWNYCGGLWLGDLRMLMWEQAESQPPARISGIPTWSWASLIVFDPTEEDGAGSRGLPVRWSHLDVGRCEELFSLKQVVFIQVDSSAWKPDFTETFIPPVESRFGNDSRFGIIGIQGRLLQISVDGYFGDEHAGITAEVSEQEPDFGRACWRRVATASSPEFVAGWASIEHPELQDDAACSSAEDIVALFIVRVPSRYRSLGLGNFWRGHFIYHVLYLRKVDRPNCSPCYERIGVGRLFENEITVLYEKAEDEMIWLV